MIDLETDANAVNGNRNGVRERTLQAVQYYNNNVLKARNSSGQFSRPSAYSSQKFRSNIEIGPSSNASVGFSVRSHNPLRHHQDHLYRSNSSLELLHDSGSANQNGNGSIQQYHQNRRNLVSPVLRREYGSHGSIDVISSQSSLAAKSNMSGSTSEQFFAMLQDYQPAVFDIMHGRSSDKAVNGNSSKTAYQQQSSSSGRKFEIHPQQPRYHHRSDNNVAVVADEEYQNIYVASGSSGSSGKSVSGTIASPKPKSKITRFWGSSSSSNIPKTSLADSSNSGTGSGNNDGTSTVSALQNYSANATVASHSNNNSVTGGGGNSSPLELEDKQRRRAFAHYDCQSIVAKLGHDSKLKGLLSQRRNTTTGASAASMATRSSTPDGADSGDEDLGDGRSNDLVESCPFFRNEVGGEEERIISLTRNYCSVRCKQPKAEEPYHKPTLSRGIAILEYAEGDTHWKSRNCCPYKRNYKTIENVDEGALYYRRYFHGQDHQNWFGIDESLGPVAVSIKREKVETSTTQVDGNANSTPSNGCTICLFRYRLIVRTSELQTIRGSVLEDAAQNFKSSQNIKNFNAKEVLEYVTPEIQLSCLRLGVNSAQIEEQLLKLDEQGISRHYKVGVLYCRAGQSTEEEMYNNEEGGPAFNEFLETIGQKIRLKGFDKYKAGLDNKSDSTGLYSVYASYQNCEIMFHVSTLLPFTPNNRQQLLRKRHIGNDIVTIVFQEPGAHAFSPKNIRSQFQHVFIIVRAIHPCSDRTQYSVAVTRSKDVALFGPPIPKGATFNKSKNFADFLLAKVINAENAAHRSDKFAAMATRTRQAYLKDLTLNCATSTVLETSQKFSMLSFSSKKKERWKPRFIPDATQRGAICWQLMLEDGIHSTIIHCFLAVSADSLVLIDEYSNNIVFVTSCKSILGWSAQSNSLRLYYHAGECITMHMRESADRDELMEVVVRLRSVTNGCPTQELTLKRNSAGQLGFHVQPDGVVTQVENMGLAWQAGLRQGARLVEICKVAVATLSHDQMVDLLKTSLLVTVTVIPSLPDNVPRRGCVLQSCKYNCFSCEADYESNSSPDDQKLNLPNPATLQQIGNHRKMYERSFSPPRSCNSSGYGTGSSSKSFSSTENRFLSTNGETVMTSLSSGNSSDDRWYDLLDADSVPGSEFVTDLVPPPPLPNRLMTTSNDTNTGNVLQKSASHSKIKATNSLPLSNTYSSSSYSLPVVLAGDVRSNNVVSSEEATYTKPLPNSHDYRIDDKIACLMKAERSHEIRRYLEKHAQENHYKHKERRLYGENSENGRSVPIPSRETHRNFMLNDDHSTDTSSSISERAFPPSEDELSVESGGHGCSSLHNVRPGSGGAAGSGSISTSSHGGSRNSSPRLKFDAGEPRLRATVTTSRSVNRNSANLTSSTLQQDLMKLINLDYNPNENSINNKDTASNNSDSVLSCNSSNSDNNTESGVNKTDGNVYTVRGNKVNAKKSKCNREKRDSMDISKNNSDIAVIKPTTTNSDGSTSSPINTPATSASLQYKISDDNRLLQVQKTPNGKKDDPHCLPLPDAREMDWPSLVDTATKAMMQVSCDEQNKIKSSASSAFLSSLQSIQNEENFHQWIDNMEDFDNQQYNNCDENLRSHRKEFHKYLSELENRLMKETQRRLTLEKEVHSLKDENRRLQQESQSAAQQLRTFTEWFFQTIDKR